RACGAVATYCEAPSFAAGRLRARGLDGHRDNRDRQQGALLQAGAPPVASGWSRMRYDPAANQIVAFVYFGLDHHEPARYTMTWDGTRWTDRSETGGPSPKWSLWSPTAGA